jgi:hypothetical protein
MGQVEEWQILAEEAIQEQDPEKLLEIIEALTLALDNRELQRSQPVREIVDASGAQRNGRQ